jgi:hypothetical protein
MLIHRKIVLTGDAGYHILCLLEKIDNRVRAQAAAAPAVSENPEAERRRGERPGVAR